MTGALSSDPTCQYFGSQSFGF